jgi:HTH-type transcriptional repressor of NAD biosynthesis genes
VQALIDEYRFDLVILLENNTPWVADGLRSLGSSVDRKEFQSLLVSLLKENEIEFVHVKESDYDPLPALRRAGEAADGEQG